MLCAMEALSEPLRFCVVTETYPPEVNGVAHTLARLVEGLSALGHRVRVVRPRQAKERDSPPGETLVPGITLPLYRDLQLGLPARRILRALWAQERPDAIYIATEGPLGLSALKEARSRGIPALSGFHTNFHTYSRHYRLGSLAAPVLRYLRWFHNRASCTLAPTPDTVRQLREQGFRDVQLLGRGVNTELFTPAKRDAALRAEWRLDDAAPGVLYVGRLAAEKNLALATRAFRAIQTANPRARFILVGDGPQRRALQRRNGDFIFCGMHIGEALARRYASADLLLFPSMTETFGNVVPEAMASGLAVLAYDYAAPRMHIRHGVNGLVVPFGDEAAYLAAAAAAVHSPQQLAAQGSAARATALTLDWPSIVSRFAALIRDYADPEAHQHEYA